MTNILQNSIGWVDRLHVVEQMKDLLRKHPHHTWADGVARSTILADHGFSAEDITQHGYAAATAIESETPEAALKELAAVASSAEEIRARQEADKYGLKGNGPVDTPTASVTEGDEWDRLAGAVERQRDTMNSRTKVVSDRLTRLSQAMRNHGAHVREEHTDRMAEADELEMLADNLEKKYSKTVGNVTQSKG